MIYDKIANAYRYFGICDNLDRALKYMMETDLNQLPLGKNIVDEDRVFVNVMDITTNSNWNAEYEYHKDYYDIHLSLTGCEKVLIADELQDETKEYDSAADYGLGHADMTLYGVGKPGYFVLTGIEELHLPGRADAGCEQPIHKAVIKVKG